MSGATTTPTSRIPFTYGRHRGIVWVCDIVGSSSYLNNPRTAKDLEEFLPRLLHVGGGIAGAAGGALLKFTGDGFLAWFPFELHRELELIAPRVLNGAWQVTFLVNVTQLGLNPGKKFRIRHGIAYEQDALLMLNASREYSGKDIIGRSVVHAFRLSGISSDFPNIVAEGEVARAVGLHSSLGQFKRRRFTNDERLKYFKGERYGVDSVYVAVPSTSKSARAGTRKLRSAVRVVEGKKAVPNHTVEFALQYAKFMSSGPKWCRELYQEQMRFLRKELYKPIKDLLRMIDEKKGHQMRN